MSTPPPLPQASNPYAAPVARVDDAPSGQLELAERVTRLGATLIDGLCVGGIGVFAAVLIPMIADKNADASRLGAGIATMVIFVAFLGVIALNLIWLHRYGQTIGKRALKIKVVRLDGSHCELWRIVFLRWLPVTLLGLIPVIGYVVSLVDPLMIFRDDRRCLHDLIADTIVVRA